MLNNKFCAVVYPDVFFVILENKIIRICNPSEIRFFLETLFHLFTAVLNLLLSPTKLSVNFEHRSLERATGDRSPVWVLPALGRKGGGREGGKGPGRLAIGSRATTSRRGSRSTRSTRLYKALYVYKLQRIRLKR